MTITMREAIPADYPAFVRLFGELGVPDPVPSAERFAVHLVPCMFVACEDGAVVGYTTWRRYGPTAHLVQLAVDPAVRGRRIGALLLEHVRVLAIASGCTRWYLNVKRDNAPALRLYERCGLRTALESWALRIAWARVPPWTGAAAAGPAEPAEAAAIAARFAMDRERVELSLSRPGYVGLALREAGEPVGFAGFDASFPGASPFCAARPELGRALLDALRPHADHARFDFVRMSIEGDPVLKDELVTLGAEVTIEMLRLAAEL
jgi:GNAT superfamily N-acetyltransferase